MLSFAGLGRRATRIHRQSSCLVRSVNESSLLSWNRPLARALSTIWQSTQADSDDNKLVKRKVVLVAGYLGTGYHGVQLNKNVATIENELRKAILSVGAMRESNFVDLGKIDWSRSSRTDKGVHASCIVFSGKLLIDDEKAVDPQTGRVLGLAESLNAFLPPTIRIFSCTRVNKRFSARKNCVLREYEYFMPLSFLKSSHLVSNDAESWDVDAAVDSFCQALRRYEGIHDFHNFTKSRSFFYRQHARARFFRAEGAKTEDASEDDATVKASENDDDPEDIDDTEDDKDDGSYSLGEYSEAASQYEDKQGVYRKPLPRHRRAIYSCSGCLIPDFYGEPYIRVHIVGQAFLLHQIRCMIGGALAVATNGMSRQIFDAALDTNRIVRIPIAPAEGLILLSSSFGGKLHSVSLLEDFNTQLATERKDVAHRTLINRAEDAEVQKFREEVIYQEVKRAWNGVANIDRWHAYLERSYEANTSIDDAELASLLEQVESAKNEKTRRQHSFVEQNRSAVIKENKPRGVLPRQFTTKLCVRYSVAPGIFTADLRRGIARHLRVGSIPLDSKEEELFAYVDKYGVSNLAEEGRQLRLSAKKAKKPETPVEEDA
ncbi:hypothetical protein Poli38472_009197 [Pythium oligandrum]|uniref:Pseudouridine synthase I TruA alpha/beta domain-containing protein n=1 Tax=Pythium oligandrum TaxID=41045 RepID=A0A8K1CLW2_PYTOL|nr:hypothetical protein Poli38472_009197 [Pythium oligandrum]|eukprot:TMW65030.1 hypothetical protein Poli38472_009197 [Pythium oligandrum]